MVSMTILPKFQLVIPKEIRELMDLISGQKIPIHFNGNVD
jgi:AbrB family looped-hinge helix DNA binding protein